MQNRYDIEAVDRMLQDIRKNPAPFGGIVTCFYGDFRQILPVIKGVESGRLARATLRTTYLWSHHIKVLRLTENVRLRNSNLTDQGRADMEAFATSLLELGNGSSASTGGSHAVDWSTGWLPDDSTAALIDAIYSDLSHGGSLTRILHLQGYTLHTEQKRRPLQSSGA